MTDADTRPNDLLLLAGKVICIVMQAGMAIGAVALTVAIPALVIFRAEVFNQFAEATDAAQLANPLLLLIGVMVLGLAIVAMMFAFFGTLRRIIATVGEGDPFAPVNATRLSRMGWLILGVQLAMLPATALGIQLAKYADEMEDVNITVDGGWDLTAILLTIILFILARVFRHGAAMREDLEGTV